VALDGDRLGPVVGFVAATVILVVCFFYREVDVPTALIRAGWAFVVGYAVTFVLVRVLLRTALTEFVSEKVKGAERTESGETGSSGTPQA